MRGRMRRRKDVEADPRPIRMSFLKALSWVAAIVLISFALAGIFWLVIFVIFHEALTQTFEAFGFIGGYTVLNGRDHIRRD